MTGAALAATHIVFAALALTPMSTSAADPPPPVVLDEGTVLARSRALYLAYRNSDATRLWQEFDDRMRRAMGSLAAFDSTLKQMSRQIGDVRQCDNERVNFEKDYWFYRADCLYAKSPIPLTLTMVYGADGRVAGFWVRPEAKPHTTPYLNYKTKTPLHLPFYGEWTVVWGGVTMQDNYHAVANDQRFAYDIVVAKDSSTHRGDGTSLADYYCFGLPIVAPAAGRVVGVKDGIADNRPGVMNPDEPVGNCVVLSHGNGEYSVFAHFKDGSIRVQLGQHVTEGDTLGLCGNSGNSSEPHLHYHMQNAPELYVAEGMPAWFTDYLSNGKPVALGMPVRGERIQRKP